MKTNILIEFLFPKWFSSLKLIFRSQFFFAGHLRSLQVLISFIFLFQHDIDLRSSCIWFIFFLPNIFNRWIWFYWSIFSFQDDSSDRKWNIRFDFPPLKIFNPRKRSFCCTVKIIIQTDPSDSISSSQTFSNDEKDHVHQFSHLCNDIHDWSTLIELHLSSWISAIDKTHDLDQYFFFRMMLVFEKYSIDSASLFETIWIDQSDHPDQFSIQQILPIVVIDLSDVISLYRTFSVN